MTEINDEFLLKQLLDFCDNIKDEEGLAEFSKADNFFHPLDREVKHLSLIHISEPTRPY